MDIRIRSDKTRYKNVEKFLKNGILELNHLQSYIPGIFDEKKVNKWTTIKSHKRLTDVTNWKLDKYEGTILDLSGNFLNKTPFHIRLIPILNIFHVIHNSYPKKKNHLWMPHDILKFSNLCDKLYKLNNTAYLDVKCSMLLSQLNDYDISPHFISVFGSYSAVMKEYSEDFSQEYRAYKGEKWFQKALMKKIIRIKDEGICTNINNLSKSISVCDLEILKPSIDLNKNSFKTCKSSESESFHDNSDEINSDDSNSDDSDSDDSDSDDDNIDEKSIIIPEMPLQVILMEKLEETFMKLIEMEVKLCRPKIIFPNFTLDTLDLEKSTNDKTDNVHLIKERNLFFEKLESWIFQICAALTSANEKIGFVHNDFHIQNIMSKTTEKQYLFYKLNGKIYKIPTHGKVMKIIDFGRSSYIYDGIHCIGDVYESDGDADGQYSVSKNEIRRMKKKNKKPITPCPGFDLPFFANSFLEEFEDEHKWPTLNNILENDIGKFIYSWMNDDTGDNFFGKIKGFKICKFIARKFRNSCPYQKLHDSLFDKFIVSDVDESKTKLYHLQPSCFF